MCLDSWVKLFASKKMSGKKRKMSEDPEITRYMTLYENEKMKDKIEEVKQALNSLDQARNEMFELQEVSITMKSKNQP